VHPKHHTDKENSSQLHYVSIIAIYLLSNKTSLMALPSFTVLLNNYTFFFNNLIIMKSRWKIVSSLHDASTTFNVAVQAFGNVQPKTGAYYTRELLFSPSTVMKSRPVYYTRVIIICEISRYHIQQC